MRKLCCLLFCALLLLPCRAARPLSDLTPGAWYEEAVTELWEEGIVSGFPDGTFRPNQAITAAEYVTVLAGLRGLTPAAGQSGHWAAGLLERARLEGWYDWDELPPTGERFDAPIQRQLAVKLLINACFPGAQGDYVTQSAKIRDFSQLDGRYYAPVLAAYALDLVHGDEHGNFHPRDGLKRAEACVLLRYAARGAQPLPAAPETAATALPPATAQGGVSENGWLQVRGTQLCNEAGEPVVLRGMSSHGLQWYAQYANAQCIQNTASFGANLFRAAMYTGEGGYLSQPERLRQALTDAVDAAIAADLYVIIDWHILSDGNPTEHQREAEDFFREMARRYGDCPAVLFELCNEPNGGAQWARDVKPYARALIDIIRQDAPRSVILIGSPTWSQDIHLAAADPLEGENLMYTLHFYAGTHGAALRERLDAALNAGLPVFVSEWGGSRADGGGGFFPEESAQWLDFLEARRISWANWSLCDKGESSAALLPGTPNDRAWSEGDLSPSGAFVFSRFSPDIEKIRRS